MYQTNRTSSTKILFSDIFIINLFEYERYACSITHNKRREVCGKLLSLTAQAF